MGINPVGNHHICATLTDVSKDVQIAVKNKADEKDKPVTSSKPAEKPIESPAVVYEKSKESVIDQNEVDNLLKESKDSTESFKKMILKLLSKQTEKHHSAHGDIYEVIKLNTGLKDFISNLQVDEATRVQAQKDIAEDGYYGVKKTSERILNFAKAISGNDPSKIEELRKAVQDGFDQAKRMWGGELPQISKDTYAAVMKGFDEWAGSFDGKGIVYNDKE